jgi:two-component system, NarL family, response regulator LiaR
MIYGRHHVRAAVNDLNLRKYGQRLRAEAPVPIIGIGNPITVVLVEDHALTRAGMRATLSVGGEVRVLAEASDGVSAEELILRERPDVAIIDIGLPGRDGIALTRAIKDAASATRVVIMTMRERDDEVLAAFSAGAEAYCVKASGPSSVLHAVRIVASGGAYLDPRIAHVVLSQFSSPALNLTDCCLTPRELEVLRLLADGIGNPEIGEWLGIRTGTVKNHVRDIMAKLKASDRTQAAINAMRRGYIR